MRGTLSILTRMLTALFTREDGGFVALCPELDVASQGASVVEAKATPRETVELFFESASEAVVVGMKWLQNACTQCLDARYRECADTLFS